MEHALVEAALHDCTDLKVLDIGGGSGFHARKAVDLGATLVDLVDVSPAMIEVGKETERQLGREGKIGWHVGDATADGLGVQGLEKKSYDVVMVFWTFDHATTTEVLQISDLAA
jgi:toxoflavin synthase